MKSFIEYIILLIKLCVKGPVKSFSLYYENYGTYKSILKSLYFWLSFILASIALLFNYGQDNPWKWANDAISIVPSILGFSLGGYAVFVSVGDKKFLEAMRGKEDKNAKSIYMEVNASFVHFIFVQFLTIAITIISKFLDMEQNIFFTFIGNLLLFYTLFTIIATAFVIFNIASWFDSMIEPDDNKKI